MITKIVQKFQKILNNIFSKWRCILQKRCKTCDLLYEEKDNNEYPGYCSKKCYKFNNNSKIKILRKGLVELSNDEDISIIKNCPICKKPFKTDRIKNEKICDKCKNDINNDDTIKKIKKEKDIKQNKMKDLLDKIESKQIDASIIEEYEKEATIKINIDDEDTDKLINVYRNFF